MKYSHQPADGVAMTLDDLAEFVAEMKQYRELPGSTVVRVVGVLEVDLQNGPRLARITADTDPAPAGPNREQRRAAGQRGPAPKGGRR